MILVTGGAGYVGSVVVEALINAGREALVIDDFSTGHREAVHPEALLVEEGMFYEGMSQFDPFDYGSLGWAIRHHEVEAVVHLASRTLIKESLDEPMTHLGWNVEAASKLLEAMIDGGVTRFIFMSSANVYGNALSPCKVADHFLQPGSPYGESKYIIERMLPWLTEIDYTVFRLFSAGGASKAYGEDHSPETHLIPSLLLTAMGQQDVLKPVFNIYGGDYHTPDGTCVRDFIHVLDVADAIIAALDTGVCGVYNLAMGIGRSVRDMHRIACEVTGVDIPVKVRPRREGDPPELVAEMADTFECLNWHPKRTIYNIVRSAWEWHQAHPDGYGE